MDTTTNDTPHPRGPAVRDCQLTWSAPDAAWVASHAQLRHLIALGPTPTAAVHALEQMAREIAPATA